MKLEFLLKIFIWISGCLRWGDPNRESPASIFKIWNSNFKIFTIHISKYFYRLPQMSQLQQGIIDLKDSVSTCLNILPSRWPVTSHDFNFMIDFNHNYDHGHHQNLNILASRWPLTSHQSDFNFQNFKNNYDHQSLNILPSRWEVIKVILIFFNSNHNDYGHHQSLNYLVVNYKNISP